MRAYIHKLRSKPEEARKQILVGSLIVSMAFVSSIWVYSFTSHPLAKANDESVSPSVSPFKLFAASISNTYENISASVGNITLSKKQQQEASPKQIDLVPVEYPNN